MFARDALNQHRRLTSVLVARGAGRRGCRTPVRTGRGSTAVPVRPGRWDAPPVPAARAADALSGRARWAFSGRGRNRRRDVPGGWPYGARPRRGPRSPACPEGESHPAGSEGCGAPLVTRARTARPPHGCAPRYRPADPTGRAAPEAKGSTSAPPTSHWSPGRGRPGPDTGARHATDRLTRQGAPHRRPRAAPPHRPRRRVRRRRPPWAPGRGLRPGRPSGHRRGRVPGRWQGQDARPDRGRAVLPGRRNHTERAGHAAPAPGSSRRLEAALR